MLEVPRTDSPEKHWTDAERKAVETIEKAKRIETKLTIEQINTLAHPTDTTGETG